MAAVATAASAATVELQLQGLSIACKLDSGSPLSFVSRSFAQRVSAVQRPVNARFVSVDDKPFKASHVCTLKVLPPDWSTAVDLDFYVIDSSIRVLIGEDGLSKLGCVLDYTSNTVQFIQRVCSVDHDACATISNSAFLKLFDLGDLANCSQLKSLLVEYRDIFSLNRFDIGRTDIINHEINTGSQQPIYVPQYRRSRVENALIENHVTDMLNHDIIEKSCSAWSSPIFLVSKKDTDEKRFVVDFRKLNDATQKERYPMLHVDDALDSLAGSTLFSSVDLSAGFWQVPLSIDSKPKTAFQTTSGQYQFKVMAFGLCNAPSTFQRLMTHITRGLNMPTYLDDIIVPTNWNVEQHVSQLRQLFERIREAHLKLNISKCHFGKRSIKYLGFVVGQGKILPDPEKVSAIAEYPIPKTPAAIQTFLGMCNFYSRFIRNFAEIAVPLYRLQNKSPKQVCREWSQECTDAFMRLRSAIAANSFLMQPDFSKRFSVDVDASEKAIGAVLYQSSPKNPIAFASRKLKSAERNYSTIDREFLALHWAILKFRPYLYGQEFTVRTDHKPLIGLLKGAPRNSRQARIQNDLSEFTFDLRHIAGDRNVVADALSRPESILNPEATPFVPVHAISVSNNDDEACNDIVKRFHNSGHFGCARTRNSIINAGYRIPYLRKRIRDCINACETCAAKSYGASYIPKGTLPNETSCKPREFVAIDLVGPLPPIQGNKFVLTMVDHATRFLVAAPLQTVSAQHVTSCFLDNWVYRYGPPKTLHSDRGPQFTSSVMNNVLRTIGIAKSFATRYHPQGNGTLERVHRTLKDRLRCAAGNWLAELNKSVYLINSTSSDGPSAHELFLGTPPQQLCDWPPREFSDNCDLRIPKFIHPRVPLPPNSLSARYGDRLRVTKRLSPQLVRAENNRVYNLRNCRIVW